MLQRRLRESERGEDDDDETEKGGKKKKKGRGKSGDFLIHGLEDDLEMSSDDSDSSMGDGKENHEVHTPSYRAYHISDSQQYCFCFNLILF